MNTEKALIFAVAGVILWKAAAKYMTPNKPTETSNPVTIQSGGSTMGATN